VGISGAADGEMKIGGKPAYLCALLKVAREYEANESTLTLDNVKCKLHAVSSRRFPSPGPATSRHRRTSHQISIRCPALSRHPGGFFLWRSLCRK
jgi:hypothetical protein